MTREEIINGLKSIAASEGLYDDKKPSKKALTLGETIKMLSTEPCKDCISRQAVLDLAYCRYAEVCSDGICSECTEREEIVDVADILELPSATPAPKTGRWITIDDCEKFIAKCSECGQIEDSRMIGKYAYCHCGAKMEREAEND